ncbi:MAG: exodeoxyribonuclease VII small subunit [Sedimentisphaerales bacterium]|nr:exodeoxyribonuclease VII small subunit [Sedimentisphaerales bacterium]
MGKQKKTNNNIEKLDFEQAITALTEVVEQIEDGEIPLADSIDKYERGMALIKRCRQILTDAEKRIDKISTDNEKDKHRESEKAKTMEEDKDTNELFQ